MAYRINYYANHCLFNKRSNRKIAMRLEILIQELDKENEPDWEGMGVPKPKGKRNYKYRRCLIDTYDIEYLKEYTDKQCILKCTWMEDAVIVEGDYDTLAVKINDLENAQYEYGEDELGE